LKKLNWPAKTLLFYYLLHFAVPGFTQDTAAIHFAKKIDAQSLKDMLVVLASDSLEGRETGERGEKRAAEYIAKQFQHIGLKPVAHEGYFQYFPLTARENRGKNIEANQKFFVYMQDYYYPDGWEDTLAVLDTIVFAGYGISDDGYDDYQNLDIRNRAVIFYGENNHKKGRKDLNQPVAERLQTAAKKGAILAIVITDSLQESIEEFKYRSKTFGDPGIRYVLVTPEMSRSFFPEYNEIKLEKSRQKIINKRRPAGFTSPSATIMNFTSDTEGITGKNVIGFLEGTDKKDEVLILTAHYDHLGIHDSLIYYGADDDASGTSAIMEIARVFSQAAQSGFRPRRSILFMAVSGEEKGLLGSKYYVTRPAVPLEKTIANLNTDMIGRTDQKHDSAGIREYVYIIGSDKLSTTLHRINESANNNFTKLKLDYLYNKPEDPNRFYYRSDHYNFAKHGIPIIFYFNGVHADYHKPGDTADKIQFDLLVKRAQLIFLTAWELANREERIKVDVESDMPNRRE
jgi:hypothetical protein